jgi:AraC-like DNA-binding protein
MNTKAETPFRIMLVNGKAFDKSARDPHSESLVRTDLPGASPLAARGVAAAGQTRFPGEATIELADSTHHAVIYTLAGSANVRWLDCASELAIKTMWFAPAGIKYSLVSPPAGWEAMWFLLDKAPPWRHFDSIAPHFRYPGQADRMVHILSGLVSELAWRPSEHDMAIHFASILGIYLERRLYAGGELELGDVRQRLSKLWQLVDGDLQKPWTVSAMAGEIALSPSHLNRLVREIHNDTPMSLLTMFRMRRTRLMLLFGNHKLEQIAQRVGYASSAALCKAFRLEFGISPGEYRRRFSNDIAQEDAITRTAIY